MNKEQIKELKEYGVLWAISDIFRTSPMNPNYPAGFSCDKCHACKNDCTYDSNGEDCNYAFENFLERELLNRECHMPYVYRVITQGDCEGKSTKDLGIWSGSIADIAFHLAEQAYYSLDFEPVSIIRPSKISSDKVIISSLTLGDLITNKEALGIGDFKIEKGGCYKGYTLYLNDKITKERKKQKLLDEKEAIEKKLKELE